MAEEKKQGKGIKIHFPDNIKSGVYANYMLVAHTKEEFVLDYMMVVPPTGAVTARVVTSPGHMKRMISALQTNLKKYEEKYGSLKEAEEPVKPPMGFHAQTGQ